MRLFLLILFLTWTVCESSLRPKHRQKVRIRLSKKDEFQKLKAFMNSRETKELLANFTKSWDESKEKFVMTRKQAVWWWETGVFEEEEEEEDERDDSVTNRFIREIVRVKRQDDCEEINRPKRKRREWRQLTPTERLSFINAFQTMAQFIPDPDATPPLSAFEIFVRLHVSSSAPGAHRGAAFLPWHREYLWRMENELRRHGFKGPFPYIDQAMDGALVDPRDSAIFSQNHLGIGTHNGLLGAPWHPVVTSGNQVCTSATVRAMPGNAGLLAYSRLKYNIVLSKTCYRDLTDGWDTDFEDYHNVGHVFFGGTMNFLSCSPKDPAFWMHHANVDCLWEDFRLLRQDDVERTLEYPLTSVGDVPAVMQWNSAMQPFTDWGLYNMHGMSNHYTNYYYQCDPRPASIGCNSTSDCVPTDIDPNPMLFCDVPFNECVAKLRDGSPCFTFWPDEQCWCEAGLGECFFGSCRCI